MKVVGLIPAAGKGTRLAPLPFSKELFPLGYQRVDLNGRVQWRPKVVSQYLIDNFVAADVHRIFFILGSGKEAIMEYFGDGHRFGVEIAYLFQEELRGMPFALNLAHPWLHDEIVAFGMPDTIIKPGDVFARLLAAHHTWQADLTLGAFRTDNPAKFGMIEIDDEDRVLRSIDKPQQTTLQYMWGMAAWSPTFGELMATYLRTHSYYNREVVLGEVFQYAIKEGLTVRAVRFDDGEYIDIGTFEELHRAIERYSALSTPTAEASASRRESSSNGPMF
jgi:glucose-1-phosphate thymidylyltransferase